MEDIQHLFHYPSVIVRFPIINFYVAQLHGRIYCCSLLLTNRLSNVALAILNGSSTLAISLTSITSQRPVTHLLIAQLVSPYFNIWNGLAIFKASQPFFMHFLHAVVDAKGRQIQPCRVRRRQHSALYYPFTHIGPR